MPRDKRTVKTHQVTARLTAREHEAVTRKAEELGMSVTTVIRDLLTMWMKNECDPYAHLKAAPKGRKTGRK